MEAIKKQKIKIRQINNQIRYEVYSRDRFTCVRCGAKGQRAGGKAILHVDHIIPVKLGGSNFMDNLQTLCNKCNLKKSDKIDSCFLKTG